MASHWTVHYLLHPTYNLLPYRLASIFIRTNGKATTIAAAAAVAKIEEDNAVVLLSYVWSPLDNKLFIAPDTDSDVIHEWSKSSIATCQHHIKQSAALPNFTYKIGVIV